jgi:hypothetical protein
MVPAFRDSQQPLSYHEPGDICSVVEGFHYCRYRSCEIGTVLPFSYHIKNTGAWTVLRNYIIDTLSRITGIKGAPRTPPPFTLLTGVTNFIFANSFLIIMPASEIGDFVSNA